MKRIFLILLLLLTLGVFNSNAQDLIACGDETDEVLAYNGSTGSFIGVLVQPGSGGLDLPRGMIQGPDGNLYIASRSSDEILRYNARNGAFIDAFVPAMSGGLDGAFRFGSLDLTEISMCQASITQKF